MIYVLGSTGMMGRYLCSYFTQQGMEFTPVSRPTLDASDDMSISRFANRLCQGDVVINVIGVTNKKLEGVSHEYVHDVNTWFPIILAGYCADVKAKMYHISTDCVYNGSKGGYTERDKTNAKDLYGMSKRLGEPPNCAVIRTSILGEGESREFLGWILNHKDSKINGYINHLWSGVTCLRLCQVLESCIKQNVYWYNVKHIFSQPVSKYDLVVYINNLYNLNKEVVKVSDKKSVDKTLGTIRRDIVFPIYNIYDDLQKQKEFALK